MLGLGILIDDLEGHRLRLFTSPRQLAPEIRGDAQRDAMEVGALASGFDARALLSRGQEHLLSGVVGVFLAEPHPAQQTPNEVEVLAHERAQLSLTLASE